MVFEKLFNRSGETESPKNPEKEPEQIVRFETPGHVDKESGKWIKGSIEKEIKPGDEVIVQRNKTGAVERDWVLSRVLAGGDMVRVIKKDESAMKDVPMTEFKAWQKALEGFSKDTTKTFNREELEELQRRETGGLSKEQQTDIMMNIAGITPGDLERSRAEFVEKVGKEAGDIMKIGNLEIKIGDPVAVMGKDNRIKFNYSLLGFTEDEVTVFNRATKQQETYGRMVFESWQLSEEAKHKREQQK